MSHAGGSATLQCHHLGTAVLHMLWKNYSSTSNTSPRAPERALALAWNPLPLHSFSRR